jgi:DNA-directed RNA polymerase specialized sigma24 family protein
MRQEFTGLIDEAALDALVFDADPNADLIASCLSGNKEAWATLVRLHTPRVYGICYRFTADNSEAQDLTEEVFRRVFRSLKNYKSDKGGFVQWLMRVTRNLLIDDCRRKKGADENFPLLKRKPQRRRKPTKSLLNPKPAVPTSSTSCPQSRML